MEVERERTMKKSIKRMASLAVAALVCLGASSCGETGQAGTTGSNSDKPKVGFMAFDIGLDPFVAVMVDEVKKQADEMGVELDVRNGGGDLNKQISQIQEFVTAGKDAIIVYPGDPEGIGPSIKAADRAGIPVFTVNLALEKSIPVKAFVGADDKDYGRKQGQMLVKAIGEEGNVGLVMGGLGTSAQILRTEGLMEVIASHPKINVIEKQSDGWQAEKTLALTQDWVNKHPKGELDAIVVQGPEAMGAITWAHDNGRKEIKWILGDYPTELKAPIADGRVFGTVSQDPAEQGREVLKAAYEWLRGDKSKVKPEMFTPLPVVTKENVAKMEPVFGL